MKGIVRTMNRRRGMVAIETDGYGYTIIELLGDDDIEVGDEMAWANDTGLGGEKYRNLTKNKVMDVYVQNHWVPPQQLRQQLLMT
jgi:hypothetical protein